MRIKINNNNPEPKEGVVFIYALCDPDTNDIRYIGKSINPKSRFYGHVQERQNTHKGNWIESLIRKEKVPVMKILEEATFDNWEDRERYYIKYYRELGCRLTNLASGGNHGYEHSSETIERISKPKNFTPEQRIAMAERGRNMSLNRDIVEKRRKTMTGRTLSKETVNKISTANTGKKRSPEVVEKMRIASTGRKMTPENVEKLKEHTTFRKPEFIAKMSAALKGRVFTDEWRKKLSDSAKLRGNNRGKWKKK